RPCHTSSACCCRTLLLVCFFLPATSPPCIYTLSLHDALPIFPFPLLSDAGLAFARTLSLPTFRAGNEVFLKRLTLILEDGVIASDRKSTRLNSSHVKISYAVFCLKKKNTRTRSMTRRQSTTTT